MLDNTSSFHCGTEVHLARLHWLCLPTYLLALRISRGSGKFVAHVQALADHFSSSRTQIWEAIKALKESGFFVLTRSGHGEVICEASEYKVLTHKEWTAKHPSQCREKFELGYADKEATDLLGRQLYAISGAYQIRFRSKRVAWYRKQLPLQDMDIEAEFREWFPQYVALQKTDSKKWRTNADYAFGEHLVSVAKKRIETVVGACA